MSFQSGPVSFRRYLVIGQTPSIIDQLLLDKLNAMNVVDLVDTDQITHGFAGGRHLRDDHITFADHVFSDSILFALRIDTNQVPGAEKRSMLLGIEEEIAAANPSGFISKMQKRQAKDQFKLQLDDAVKSGRHRKTRLIPLLWDVARGVLYTPAQGDAAARIGDLLDVSLNLTLDPVTAGTLALRHLADLGKRRDYEDARPTAFIPHAGEGEPAYPWAARCDQPRDWLGNEFLLWLWFTAGSDNPAVIDRLLHLDCAWGITGSDTLRGDTPQLRADARAALRTGKVPRKAGLIMEASRQAFNFQLDAESFALTSARLPEVDEADTPRVLIEARIGLLRDLCGTLDAAYCDFLAIRLSRAWPAIVESIRAWIHVGAGHAPPSSSL